MAASRGADLEGIGSADAARVLELATRHQVAGLIHHAAAGALADRSRDAWREARAAFEAIFWHTTACNECLRSQLIELHRALSEAGVEALILKGPSLAFRAYPHPGARPIGDVDLCIREADYAAVLRVLDELDYVAEQPPPADGAQAMQRAQFVEQMRFTGAGKASIELHFRLVNLGPPEPEPWLWSTARDLDLGAGVIRVPGAEALVFHLALHVAQHGFAVLRLLHDVAFALAADDLNVEQLTGLAQRYRCKTALGESLRLARDMAGAPVPSALDQALEVGPLQRAWFERKWSIERVRRLDAPQRATPLEAPRLYLLEMGTFGSKLGYVRDVARGRGGFARLLRDAASASPTETPATAYAGDGMPGRLPARPRLRDDARVFEIDGRRLVHVPGGERTLVLEGDLLPLPELCDGKRAVGEVVSALARAAGAPESGITPRAVQAVLELDRGRFLADLGR